MKEAHDRKKPKGMPGENLLQMRHELKMRTRIKGEKRAQIRENLLQTRHDLKMRFSWRGGKEDVK